MMKTTSENAPVKSPKRAIAIANRNNDQEINLLTTDWARINRELGRAEEDEFPQGADRPWICSKQDAPARNCEGIGIALPSDKRVTLPKVCP
jgi:hypothetical protein